MVWLLTQSAGAKVVVLANRTVAPITIEIARSGELPANLIIPSGDSQPVFFPRALQVRFGDGLQRQKFALNPGSAYFFSRSADNAALQLEQIGLGEVAPSAVDAQLTIPTTVAESATITVKILADDNEPTHRQLWEPRLRKRVAEASAILERHSGVRLKVIEVSTWESDDKQRNFQQTLREFEREVKPQPAQLAIGFSGQYQATRGRSHLGVTRWPLHSHILLKERSRNLTEAERLELLVHELGHYLGASHSPEPQSVMRPLLTRGPQRGVGSRIQFDPVNALIVATMGEEIRRHGTRDIRKISQPTVERLKPIYGILAQAMPGDPAARQYLRILEAMKQAERVTRVPPQNSTPLVRDTRQVLGRLMQVAAQQSVAEETLSGDEVTNLYVRQAALAASRMRSANAKRAMLLALGIFVDDTDSLRSLPKIGAFITQVENDEQRSERIKTMGKPTMRERTDLVKHFFVSAHLVVAAGTEATATAGLVKERADSQGGTGFSFVDMAANRAGIVFAESLLADKLKLADVARGFHVDDYLPTLRGLEEGLSAAELQSRYGGEGQPTVDEQLQEIEQRVLSLPVYDFVE